MATISVTVPDGAVVRIRNAVASTTGVPAPATSAQVNDLIRQYLRGLCVQVEAQQRTTVASTDATAAVEVEFPLG